MNASFHEFRKYSDSFKCILYVFDVYFSYQIYSQALNVYHVEQCLNEMTKI
jgi:hypothetical protein